MSSCRGIGHNREVNNGADEKTNGAHPIVRRNRRRENVSFLDPAIRCLLAQEFTLCILAASVGQSPYSDGAGPEESPTISSAEIW